jgi:hypothetical protein
MGKLKLVAEPTFKANVNIPVPGAEPAVVEFTFRHRTRKQLQDWLQEERDDATAVTEMAVGWDLVEPLDKDSAELLVQNYYGAAREVLNVYLDELTQARTKNS